MHNQIASFRAALDARPVQLTLNAFASNFYPAHVRATGTGWALGVGRFGSILGPLFGSLLLAMHIPVAQIFFFCAIPAVVAALLIIQVRAPSEATHNPVGTSLLAKSDSAV